MSQFSLNRREYLKTSVGGILFAGVASKTASANSVADGPTVFAGTTGQKYNNYKNSALYAVDVASGEKVWSFTDCSGIYSSPTVVNGTIYFGSRDNTLYAVDAASGEKVWAFTDLSSSIESSPTVVDGTVYVGSRDATMYAVDAVSGEQEWEFETADSIYSSPNVVQDTVYVGSRDTTLYAIDAASGEQEWAFTEPSDWIDASPTVVGGTVYVGTNNGTLYAVDASLGEQEWALSNFSYINRAVTVKNGTIYVGDNSLYAIDAASGEQEWIFEASSEIQSAPTVVDGTAYVGTLDTNLYALDETSGEQKWSTDLSSSIYSSIYTVPTVADGIVYVGSTNNTLHAVDTASEEQKWAFTDPSSSVRSSIVSSPTVVEKPADGHSVDSRVNLGTLGHHHVFAERGPTGPGIPDDPELGTSITGIITDSASDPLENIEIRAENRVTDDVTTTATNADGEYNIALEANTEYRIFIFDQFGLEQTEFEEIVELNEEETRELNIELLSKFEVFKEQKLGSDRIAGLAPRIDDLSTPLITEQNTVEAEIDGIESGVENGQIGQEFADELVERMVFGEAMVTRSLEALIDTTPTNLAGYDWSQGPLIYEDEMPDYDLLFQTSKAIVIGLVEASYSLKKIAKEALGEFGDQIRSRILTAIGNFIRDRLSDFQRVLDTAESAWSIREMLVEIKAAADEALVRIQEGPTDDNKRAVILELAEPIAEQIATSLLAGVELLTIEDQLAELNNILSSDSLGTNFANDITTIADNTRTALRDVETKVQQAEDAMEPESDALEGLLDLVSELADAGLTDVPALLNSIWDIVRSLVSVISSGFNIGFGIVRARDVYTDSATVVNDITDTV